MDNCVYNAYPKGDGCFDDDQERMFQLTKAVKACLKAHNEALLKKWDTYQD
jgi:hypothetical protein